MIVGTSGGIRAPAPASRLRIGGFERLSAVDWPGELVAVIFCQGCGWECGYCHNPHLIPFAPPARAFAWADVLRWLERRRGLLDGVVFSGGEPTLQPALTDAIAAVRALGFRIALHTGGPAPEAFAAVLPELSWVGFDFKAPFDRYAIVTRHDHGGRARDSLERLLAAGVACEIRTTWHPRLLTPDDLRVMADTLVAAGVRRWTVQRFRPEGCANPALQTTARDPFPDALLALPDLAVTLR